MNNRIEAEAMDAYSVAVAGAAGPVAPPSSRSRSAEPVFDLHRRFGSLGGAMAVAAADRLQHLAPKTRTSRITGSGVIFDSHGRAITRAHVVEGASKPDSISAVLSDGRPSDRVCRRGGRYPRPPARHDTPLPVAELVSTPVKVGSWSWQSAILSA